MEGQFWNISHLLNLSRISVESIIPRQSILVLCLEIAFDSSGSSFQELGCYIKPFVCEVGFCGSHSEEEEPCRYCEI